MIDRDIGYVCALAVLAGLFVSRFSVNEARRRLVCDGSVPAVFVFALIVGVLMTVVAALVFACAVIDSLHGGTT